MASHVCDEKHTLEQHAIRDEKRRWTSLRTFRMQMPRSLSLEERRHDHEEQEGSSSFTIIDLIRKHWHPIRVTDKYRNQLTTLIGRERERRLHYQTNSRDNPQYRPRECNCVSYSNSTLSCSMLKRWMEACMYVDFVREQFDLFIVLAVSSRRTCADDIEHFMSKAKLSEEATSNVQWSQIRSLLFFS